MSTREQGEEDRLKIISLIHERDRWRAVAEEKIGLRREIHEALGIQTGDTNDEALTKGVNAIRALRCEAASNATELAEAQRQAKHARDRHAEKDLAYGKALAERDQLRDEVERLSLSLEDNFARGIHTCHAKCTRVECVQRREIAELLANLSAAQDREDRNHSDLCDWREIARELYAYAKAYESKRLDSLAEKLNHLERTT